MKYFIGVSNSNQSNLRISFKEYGSLKRAQSILVNARAIEEKYDIVILNYLTLENYLLCTTNELMIRYGHDYSEFFNIRHNLDVHIVNLLSSARLYRDQLTRNVKGCIPNNTKVNELIKSLLAKEYDSKRDYRFMEAFRNYVQHCGLPVHSTNENFRRKKYKIEDIFEYGLDFFAQITHLKNDNDFKKAVLVEIEDNTNLKASLRGYVESISIIHESVRDLIHQSVTEARILVERTHKKIRPSGKSFNNALRAFADDGKGHLSSIPLLLAWDDCRIGLEKKNRTLKNLKRRFVSTE
jgi:hypothetical protein